MKHIAQFFAGVGILVTMHATCRVFDWPAPTPVDNFPIFAIVGIAWEVADKK